MTKTPSNNTVTYSHLANSTLLQIKLFTHPQHYIAVTFSLPFSSSSYILVYPLSPFPPPLLLNLFRTLIVILCTNIIHPFILNRFPSSFLSQDPAIFSSIRAILLSPISSSYLFNILSFSSFLFFYFHSPPLYPWNSTPHSANCTFYTA